MFKKLSPPIALALAAIALFCTIEVDPSVYEVVETKYEVVIPEVVFSEDPGGVIGEEGFRSAFARRLTSVFYMMRIANKAPRRRRQAGPLSYDVMHKNQEHWGPNSPAAGVAAI